MTVSSKTDYVILLIGDACVLLLSLWLALSLRSLEIPTYESYIRHLKPFLSIFAVSFLVYFIAGLYEQYTVVFQQRLPTLIAIAHIVNSVIAALFFYFVPVFGIAPKTILAIYLVVSYLLFLLWRKGLFITISTREKQNALLIGSGKETEELFREVNANYRYNIRFVAMLELNNLHGDIYEEVERAIQKQKVDSIVLDLEHEKVSQSITELYNLMFTGVHFVDINRLYEDIFERIPLSILRHNWFLENISSAPKKLYDALKRTMDIAASLILGFFALALFPFVYLAIKLDDGGPILIRQKRIGKHGKEVGIYKYRTMTTDDSGNEETKAVNKPTRVGPVLRKMHVDELPQLWNLLRGDISLIGPRPELPVFVARYEHKIPHYKVRHLIKPGLSGWAQLYHKDPPKREADFDKTREKLSYDLYYIKNRSLILDLKIALKTVKTVISGS